MKFPPLLLLPICLGLSDVSRANSFENWRAQVSSLLGQKQQKQQAAREAYQNANAKKQRAQFLHERLEKTQQLLERANANYREVSGQLNETEAAIARSRREIRRAEARLARHQKQFGTRLAALQKNGKTSFIGLALGAQSLGDLSRRAQFFQTVARYDATLARDLKNDRVQLLEARNRLMAQWNERLALLKRVGRERARVAQGERQQRLMWRQLEGSRQEMLRYAVAQQRSSQEITAMIGNLQARRAQLIANYNAQVERERQERAQFARAERRAREISRSNRYVEDAPRPRSQTRYANPRYANPRYTTRRSNERRTSNPRYAPRVNLGSGYASQIEVGPRYAPQISSRGGWVSPARGRFSSRFGMRFHPVLRRWKLHTGQDIAAPYGSPIRAAHGGLVLFSGWKTAYGNCVIVDIGGGTTVLYGHASRLDARAGQSVGAGEILGAVGSTGFSTGPHLHFEIRRGGVAVNPMRYLR